MNVAIGCVVEGHGDREALPVLIRRIVREVSSHTIVKIPNPIRIPKNKLLKPNELERAVELAARKIGQSGALIVMLDSDADCPAEQGPTLLQRARAVRNDLPIAVVLAKREFESWFLASAESLSGKRGLHHNLTAPHDPEEIQGAKEWLSHHMGNGTYGETLDQPALAALFDLKLARQRSNSFDKCYREITRLVKVLLDS
jgi:hypothetical protein